MSLDYRTLANLRDLLAKLYVFPRDILRVVTTVGLEPSFIAFDDRAVNTWHDVLIQADNHNLVMAVIDLAKKENPNVQSLDLAAKDALLAIETPELPEGDWHGPKDEGGLEKIIGAMSTLRPIGFLLRGFDVARSVGRVVLANGSTGSGFLINNNLLVTNNHVLPDKDTARGAHVEFNYQKDKMGLDEPADPYDLDPDADHGFATSPKEEQGGDDWTAVKVKGDPAKWGTVPLVELPDGTPKAQDEVIIIQHPGGGQKQIALSHNTIVYADKRRIQYLTDTLEGSSGSPVFNTDWRIVGLHHKGGWNTLPSKKPVYSNQGIHINVVIQGLRDKGLL